MPQGVEHIIYDVTAISGKSVQESLMPQGVEHVQWTTNSAVCRKVQESLMPQGVEHRLARGAIPTRS